jgi:hypothetical protein
MSGLLGVNTPLAEGLFSPATANPLMARQFAAARKNMTPPGLMDPGYFEWKKRQEQADHFLLGADIAGAVLPGVGPAVKGAATLGRSLAPKAADMAEGYMAKRGLLHYATKPEYQGGHRPPLRESGAPAHDLTGGGQIYPNDVYGPKAAQFYGHYGQNDPLDVETFRLLTQIKGNPEAELTIYRAIPKDGPSAINSGDWVTVNKNYAVTHGESALQGNYKIVEQKVKAKDIFTNGDSIHEWGYDPMGK